jgi:uncharacterized protein YwgA
MITETLASGMSCQNLSEREAVPLTLLSAVDSSEVQGTTRLQKLVFLAQNGGLDDDPIPDDPVPDDEFEPFEFEPHNYGPFSVDLAKTLDRLENSGLIETNTARTSSGNSRKDYRISEQGRQRLEECELSSDEERVLEAVKILYSDTPLLKLLKEVYNDYPQSAENSELDIDLS